MSNEENEQPTVEIIDAPQKEFVEVEEKPEGMSLRDALEVAHTAATDKEEPEPKEKEEKVVAQATNETPKELPAYNPPADWNAEERADFLASTRKQQEAALRLNKSRSSKIYEIQKATEEYRDTKALAESIAPYIKAMGLKESPQVALQKATTLWKEFEYAEDPKKAAAQYLLAKGIEPPKEWLSEKSFDPSEEKIRALQEEVNAVKARQVQEDQSRRQSYILQTWNAFENTKNASGNLRYPDLAKPTGPQLADDIGSLVRGDTDYSKQFIARVQRRIPDPTPLQLIHEAYRISGGQVDDSITPKSQSATNHLQKAKRAASSRPGSSVGVSANGSTDKKFDLRGALERAVSDSMEN